MKTDINLQLQQLVELDNRIEKIKADNLVKIEEAKKKYAYDIEQLKSQVQDVKEETSALKENRLKQINNQVSEMKKNARSEMERSDKYFEEKKDDIVNQLYSVLFEIEE